MFRRNDGADSLKDYKTGLLFVKRPVFYCRKKFKKTIDKEKKIVYNSFCSLFEVCLDSSDGRAED